jgi:hypothetical protein
MIFTPYNKFQAANALSQFVAGQTLADLIRQLRQIQMQESLQLRSLCESQGMRVMARFDEHIKGTNMIFFKYIFQRIRACTSNQVFMIVTAVGRK